MTPLAIDRVISMLTPGEIVWSIRYEPSCESTQDLARRAAAGGAEQGWLVVTDEQRAGRGRQGRRWVAPPGTALLFSIVLRPPIDVLPLLPLLAGVVVAGAVELQTAAPPDLKWPNDVLLQGAKLAGILLERPAAAAAVILGLGLNVNQSVAELPEGAISLAVALGHPVDREPVLATILNDLGNAYERADREGVEWIVPAWRSRSTMLRKRVTFERNDEAVAGIAEDVGDDGALIVRLDDGQQTRVIAGDVRQVRLS